MNDFTKKYEKKIVGILTGFDRVVFRGTLRTLSYQMGMLNFLHSMGILLKDFGSYVEKQTAILKEASLKEAKVLNRPIKYLSSCKTRKEPIAREIVKKENITTGLICILKCVEPCVTYEIFKNKETKKLELKSKYGQCMYLYHYWIDPVFGFMSARIQTWFPFSIQICMNGREFLAKRLDEGKIFYGKEDNCFPYIDNFEKAQKLMDSMLDLSWDKSFKEIVERLNPAHDKIFSPVNQEYYWSVHQSEMATDVLFETSRSLDRIYPSLVRGAMSNFSCSDVMTFLGRTLNSSFKGMFNTDLRNLTQGTRIKHYINGNSIKAYNKKGSILRVETTINNPKDFRVYRTKEGDVDGNLEWRGMRKGIADIHRRAEISKNCNNRYLDALSALDTDETLPCFIQPVCQSARWKKRSIRGLRPWTQKDILLLSIINRGEFVINGFSNKDIVSLFFSKNFSNIKDKRCASAKVTRMISMLRAHGIIRKISNRYRYQISKKGRKIITAILQSQRVTLQQLNDIAA